MSDLTAVVHDYLNTYRFGSGDHLWSTKVGKSLLVSLVSELIKVVDGCTLEDLATAASFSATVHPT